MLPHSGAGVLPRSTFGSLRLVARFFTRGASASAWAAAWSEALDSVVLAEVLRRVGGFYIMLYYGSYYV